MKQTTPIPAITILLSAILVSTVLLFLHHTRRHPRPATSAAETGSRTAPGAPAPSNADRATPTQQSPLQSDETDASNEPTLVLPSFADVEDAIPNEYVFSFYDSRDRDAFEALARSLGVTILDSMTVGNALRISVTDKNLLRELLTKGPTPIDWMPNTYVRIPEGENNIPLAAKTGYTAFGANALEWLGITDNATWGSGVTVGVLDSGIASVASLDGVSISHLDLVGAAGGNTHGTAVASLIAGAGGTVRGVAPGVDLLSVRIITDDGGGDAFTLARGIIEAVDRGANVLCAAVASRSGNTILQAAIQYAVDRGVLFVAAAGNDALQGVSYPARYNGVVAVSAVDAKGEHLYFSNRGNELVVAAPGAGVAASQAAGDAILFTGTSAAAPFVAGAIAALLSNDPDLDLDEIIELLKRHSNDAGAPGDDDNYGSGILDAGRLMEYDTAGIYDMAVMAPYISHDESTATVRIYVAAQNRGTEPIGEVELRVSWGGIPETFTFHNVSVGQTVSRSFSFASDTIAEDGIDLQVIAIPVGISDTRPGNNALNSRISAVN